MALRDTKYRIKVDNNYASNAIAITIKTALDNVMIAQGLPQRATVTGSNVLLMVPGLNETTATLLGGLLQTAWTTTARVSGKASVVRTNDLD